MEILMIEAGLTKACKSNIDQKPVNHSHISYLARPIHYEITDHNSRAALFQISLDFLGRMEMGLQLMTGQSQEEERLASLIII